ncbi:hypothetical protein [Streptomyces sp. ODS28]|uniref:hypothetical protein n=1 Tax=Streptomyces sp. ODS28 TaxID=3136688 RepID=UPI0031EBCBC2
MSSQPTRVAWENAALMLDDVYGFVSVGPRQHQDWRRDAVPVLRREAEDPRGWRGDLPEEPERHQEGPFYPFEPVTPEALDAHLSEITLSSATSLVALLSADDPFWPRTISRETRACSRSACTASTSDSSRYPVRRSA